MAALPPGWKPIASAPRDGRVVILKVKGKSRLGKYGVHGRIPGWISAGSTEAESSIIWPQPEEWAERSFKDEDTPKYHNGGFSRPDSPMFYRSLFEKVFDPVFRWRAVYVMEGAELGAVKVGYSYDPAKRLMDLKRSVPFELVMRGLVFGEDHQIAALERDVHDRLKSKGVHLRGEWFKLGWRSAMGEVMAQAEDRGFDVHDIDAVGRLYSEHPESDDPDYLNFGSILDRAKKMIVSETDVVDSSSGITDTIKSE